jgi:hypothetical protein
VDVRIGHATRRVAAASDAWAWIPELLTTVCRSNIKLRGLSWGYAAREGAGNGTRLAGDADKTRVVFSNCYRDCTHVGARQTGGLFSERAFDFKRLRYVSLSL